MEGDHRQPVPLFQVHRTKRPCRVGVRARHSSDLSCTRREADSALESDTLRVQGPPPDRLVRHPARAGSRTRTSHAASGASPRAHASPDEQERPAPCAHVAHGEPEENPEVDSLTGLWSVTNFLEREVWDMYGIKFKNHPDLRRIMMYDEFEGHPLRKDYPVQGKQPRVQLRHPEVENTARLMQRPALVQINSKKEKDPAGEQRA